MIADISSKSLRRCLAQKEALRDAGSKFRQSPLADDPGGSQKVYNNARDAKKNVRSFLYPYRGIEPRPTANASQMFLLMRGGHPSR